MFKLLGGKDFAAVKPAFREFIYNKLQKGEGAPALDEQLRGLSEELGECFQQTEKQEATAPRILPQFSDAPAGSVPTGDNDPVSKITDIWGFGRK